MPPVSSKILKNEERLASPLDHIRPDRHRVVCRARRSPPNGRASVPLAVVESAKFTPIESGLPVSRRRYCAASAPLAPVMFADCDRAARSDRMVSWPWSVGRPFRPPNPNEPKSAETLGGSNFLPPNHIDPQFREQNLASFRSFTLFSTAPSATLLSQILPPPPDNPLCQRTRRDVTPPPYIRPAKNIIFRYSVESDRLIRHLKSPISNSHFRLAAPSLVGCAGPARRQPSSPLWHRIQFT